MFILTLTSAYLFSQWFGYFRLSNEKSLCLRVLDTVLKWFIDFIDIFTTMPTCAYSFT